jgi:hypothetical protein
MTIRHTLFFRPVFFRAVFFVALLPLGLATAAVQAAKPRHGPFDPERWPPTIDLKRKVHFVSVDGAFTAPAPDWTPNLKILTGGDHQTEPDRAGGHDCVRIAMFKFNTADDQYALWADHHEVDVLLQVFGDDALLNKDGTPRYFNFLTGTLPEPIAVDGGSYPVEARNGRWNWMLFRVPNGLRHMDGGRLIGTIHPKAKADPGILGVSRLSGQNGGTIRIDGLPGAKIRLVAFGEKGAFGEPEQVNRFRAPARSR